MKLLNSFWFVDVGRLLYNGPTISHFIINCWNQKSNWLNEMNEIEWVGRLVCEWNEWNEESELWNWWKKFNSIEFHGINWANAAWVEWMKRRPKGPNAPRQAQINKLNLSSPAQARWKDWICWFAFGFPLFEKKFHFFSLTFHSSQSEANYIPIAFVFSFGLSFHNNKLISSINLSILSLIFYF